MIQTITTKSRRSSTNPPVPGKLKRTERLYQIPRYSVQPGSKFPVKPALYLAGSVAVVLVCTELALYLHPDMSRSFALLLTVVCGTSAILGEYVSRVLRRAIKQGGAQ